MAEIIHRRLREFALCDAALVQSEAAAAWLASTDHAPPGVREYLIDLLEWRAGEVRAERDRLLAYFDGLADAASASEPQAPAISLVPAPQGARTQPSDPDLPARPRILPVLDFIDLRDDEPA